MSSNKSFSSETSERYARAIFELALENSELDNVENSLKELLNIYNSSLDLESFIKNNKTNIKVYANYTVQTYNLLHMLDAIDFFLERNFIPVLHPVTHPQYLNIKNIPDALKEDVVSKIYKKIDFLKFLKFI